MAAVEATQPTWEELHGSNEWDGLLGPPMHLNLRKFILQCGEFSQATADGFNNDSNSNYYGSCHFDKKSFLNKVYLPSASDYQVVAFLYIPANIDVCVKALPHGIWDNNQSSWMGYIAVSTDEVSKANGRREIYVVWRGTMLPHEWCLDFACLPVSAKPLLASGHDSGWACVMLGWLKFYNTDNPHSGLTKDSGRTQLLKHIRNLVNKYKDEKLSLTFTGHSLGAALAGLTAFDVAENVTQDIPIAAVVFAMPKLGNEAFINIMKAHRNLKILHVKNTDDIVPLWPLVGYATVGTELVVDFKKSPYLQCPKGWLTNPLVWHNLETLLHIVAGWNGKDEKFGPLKVNRDLALVNKSSNLLDPKFEVPKSWWAVGHKGMVLNEDGRWTETVPEL